MRIGCRPERSDGWWHARDDEDRLAALEQDDWQSLTRMTARVERETEATGGDGARRRPLGSERERAGV